MLKRARPIKNLVSLGCLGFLLAACAGMEGGATATPSPGVYRLGGTAFEFPAGTLLQTWPVIPYSTPPHFARLAARVPVEQLVPELAGYREVVQIDVLQAQFIPDADAVVRAAFADWQGREEAPAQSAYKFLITSKRGATGQQIAYLRQAQKTIGLVSLAPFQPQEGAPIYLVALDGTQVTTLIECAPVPVAYGGGNYCSLRRKMSDAYGYRVLFPQDLLSHWQAFDEAARDYVNAAEK